MAPGGGAIRRRGRLSRYTGRPRSSPRGLSGRRCGSRAIGLWSGRLSLFGLPVSVLSLAILSLAVLSMAGSSLVGLRSVAGAGLETGWRSGVGLDVFSTVAGARAAGRVSVTDPGCCGVVCRATVR